MRISKSGTLSNLFRALLRQSTLNISFDVIDVLKPYTKSQHIFGNTDLHALLNAGAPCVLVAGCVMVDLASPKFAVIKSIWLVSTTDQVASCPPFIVKRNDASKSILLHRCQCMLRMALQPSVENLFHAGMIFATSLRAQVLQQNVHASAVTVFRYR